MSNPERPVSPGEPQDAEARKAEQVVDAWEEAERESMREGHRATLERFIAQALQSAHLAGARAALEKAEAVAVAEANRWLNGNPMRSDARADACMGVAAAIRRLANPEDKGPQRKSLISG